MTRAIIVLYLIGPVLGLATEVWAQSPRAFVQTHSFEFGTVVQGEKVVRTFPIRNKGQAPLALQRTELSAPGMTAKFKPSVPPGGEGILAIEWNTASVAGRVQGKVIVYCNDPAQPQLTFALEGTVKPPIDIIPFPAVFASVFKGESAERTVRIIDNEDRPLRIEGIESNSGHFKVTLEAVREGKEYELAVKVSSDVPPGRYTETLYLKTDHPTLSRLTVTVNLLVKNDLYANPEVVDFGEISLAYLTKYAESLDLLTQSFMVKKRKGEFEIKSLTSSLPCLLVARSPASGESTGFRIDVGLIRDKLQPGRFAGAIRVQTDDTNFPELTIPVRGEVR